jgi:hypothetical protein
VNQVHRGYELTVWFRTPERMLAEAVGPVGTDRDLAAVVGAVRARRAPVPT